MISIVMKVKHLYHLIFLFCIFSSNYAIAGKHIAPDVSPPSYEYDFLQFPKAISSPEQLTIPLKKAGNLFIIEAKIDSIVGNFIFDTGAPGLVLNKTYFRDYQKVYNSSEAGITGANSQYFRKKIASFEVSNLRFKNILADVTELGHLENKRKTKILGLIGASFLKDFEAIVDYKNSVMHLYAVDKKGKLLHPNSSLYSIKQKYKIQYTNNVICVQAAIGGKAIKFCLDTGAESNVIDIASKNEILETVSITKRVELSGASSKKTEVFYGFMNEFSINNLNIPKMGTMLTDLSNLRKVYGISIYGMLGYDFFKQGLISINIRKKELGIQLYKEAKQ